MAKDWDYAALSKWASHNGGPEAALNMVKDFYFKKGHKQGAASKNPWLVASWFGGAAVGVAVKWAYDKHLQKTALIADTEAIKNNDIQKAEAVLIAEMEKGETEEPSVVADGDMGGVESEKETE